MELDVRTAGGLLVPVSGILHEPAAPSRTWTETFSRVRAQPAPTSRAAWEAGPGEGGRWWLASLG